MKMIIVALALVAVAAAAAVPPAILRSESNLDPQGGYNFAFETEDGILRTENGELKQLPDEDGKPHDVVVVRGSYTYLDPDNVKLTITYVADESGFHAEGDSIPKNSAVRR